MTAEATKKIHNKISQEDIDIAANTNLVDFLKGQGHQVKRVGSSFFWTSGGHDSVALFGDNYHMFKHFSRGTSGNAISFLKEFLGYNFSDAVNILSGRHACQEPEQVQAATPFLPQKPGFVPPIKASSQEGCLKYLLSRGISEPILKEFMARGDIYMESLKSNVVFLSKDYQGEPVGAIKRSVKAEGFKGNHKASDMSYGFRYEIPTPMLNSWGRVFLFEAPIDMLSYMTLMAAPQPGDTFIATGGAGSHKSLIKYLEFMEQEGRCAPEVWLCLDNDAVGLEQTIKLLDKPEISGHRGGVFVNIPKFEKDWNEMLLKHGCNNNSTVLDKQSRLFKAKEARALLPELLEVAKLLECKYARKEAMNLALR